MVWLAGFAGCSFLLELGVGEEAGFPACGGAREVDLGGMDVAFGDGFTRSWCQRKSVLGLTEKIDQVRRGPISSWAWVCGHSGPCGSVVVQPPILLPQ